MPLLHTLRMLFLGLISLLGSNLAMGQEKVDVAAGLGLPELLNLGIRYQMGQSQLGLSAGFYPDSYDDNFSVGADYYYHFGGSSLIVTRRPWYGRIGLNYYVFENDYESKKYLLLVPRIGKDFNLSPRVGIAADGGVSVILSRIEEEILSGSDVRNDIALSLGFSIFYRL